MHDGTVAQCAVEIAEGYAEAGEMAEAAGRASALHLQLGLTYFCGSCCRGRGEPWLILVLMRMEVNARSLRV